MSSRASRTSSIPIPTTPAGLRNIENVISIPSSSSSSFNRAAPPPSSLLTSPASPPLPRSVPRSASLSLSRSSFRQNFEPRVIRAAPPPAQEPSRPSSSPTATRRPSNTAHVQTSSRQNRVLSSPSVIQPMRAPSSGAFPRPAYLNSSFFKDSLVTEAPPPLVPPRKPDAPTSATSASYGAISTLSPSPDSDEDHLSSPPPRPSSSGASTSSIMIQQTYKLPTRWSSEDRHPLLSVSSDGRDLIHNGSASSGDREKDGSAARANHPIPPVCGIYYYEVEIRGKHQKSHVSIGFSAPTVKNSRLPGLEQQSWGYHGDVGYTFAGEVTGANYMHPYGSGDIVGCGIDFTLRRAFYTKNGQFLGHVFENVGRGIDLYPAVGLQHHQETIRVNFGQEPFVFDIENHVHHQKAVVWGQIMSTPLHIASSISGALNPTSNTALTEEEYKVVLNDLVISYLVHHGYAKTVRAFQKQDRASGTPTPKVVEDKDVVMEGTSPRKPALVISNLEDDIEHRKQIVNAVVAGDIDTALNETERHYPSVLEAEAGLMKFKLRCRKFVELVLATTEMKKGMERESSVDRAKNPTPTITASSVVPDGRDDWLGDDMDMDVDDDATAPSGTTTNTSTADYEVAIKAAIAYGTLISDEYKNDPRPIVQSIFHETFGILAWDHPLEAGNEVASFVSKEARVALANELNQAILKSQGRPAKPALETLYRHASACVAQLGVLGDGRAAFADVHRELLEV